METILLWSSCQLAQKIRYLLLFVDAQIVLRCSKEYNASFTNGNGQVTKLLLRVLRMQDVFDFGIWVFSADDRGNINVFQVVNRSRVLESFAS